VVTYHRRIIDDELDGLLGGLPAIALEGARGVGKTETALQRARTVYRLDDPGVRQAVEADPSLITTGAPPILIDEWQRLPWSWDVVRRAVDDDRSPGRFILTGSADPVSPSTHSGAGRIVTLRMRPMSLPERGVDITTVSLRNLLEGGRPPISGRTGVRLERYASEIVRSGLPALHALPDRLVRPSLDSYLRRVVDRDIEDAGRPVRDPLALTRWLTAYAGAVSTTASYEAIRDAATSAAADRPAKTTVLRWIDTFERIRMIDPVAAWSPTRNQLSRLMLHPRHQVTDPAFAARLRRATVASLLGGTRAGVGAPRDGTLLGALFESLVTLSVQVAAQAAEARVGYLRTKNGDHEVDLIVEGVDGRVVAIEVKLAATPHDGHMRHLRWLRERLGDDLLDALVITTGTYAYRTSDGIAIVPAALLGP